MPNAMTYDDIRDIMYSKGLASDPAFRNVNFAIVDKQLPCLTEGCPLGLYFPDNEHMAGLGNVPSKTIVIPYDCSEGVLIHELGHHWGNVYKHDLSEKFAENYRQKYGGAVPSMACAQFACMSCIPKLAYPPKTDVERAMTHYGISAEEYLSHPEFYPLPQRGRYPFVATEGNDSIPSWVLGIGVGAAVLLVAAAVAARR